MKWPLSMSFAKLISRTADAGQARYTLPGPGLLNPDTEYFWRVRAEDDKGVWGPWSPTWSFTPRGPAPPRDVRLEFDRERDRGVLRWEPNPLGRKPVAYRVYASDEKGFSVSDRPYKVTVGVIRRMCPPSSPRTSWPKPRPPNWRWSALTCELQGANKAFYRVVAVDAAGKRSGPSDYAASPRPVIFSKPVTGATKGVEYRYPVAAIRSLGDLRTRVIDGKETMGFWDIERLRFEIQRGPEWLTIDGATGLLSGTPDRSGHGRGGRRRDARTRRAPPGRGGSQVGESRRSSLPARRRPAVPPRASSSTWTPRTDRVGSRLGGESKGAAGIVEIEISPLERARARRRSRLVIAAGTSRTVSVVGRSSSAPPARNDAAHRSINQLTAHASIMIDTIP